MNVLIVYYSTYGNVFKMAQLVAEGVKQVPGAEPVIRTVPELIPQSVIESHADGALEISARQNLIPERSDNPVDVTLAFGVAATLLGVAVVPFADLPAWELPLALSVGVGLLVGPGVRLARSGAGADAHRLFNLASFYPLAMVVAFGAGYVVPGWFS